MKKTIAALLIAGNCGATNLMYTPMADPVSGEPLMIYFTDQHSAKCKDQWYAITVEANGRLIKTRPSCWGYQFARPAIFFPDTGLIERMPNAGIVQGSERQLQAFMEQVQRDTQKSAQDNAKAAQARPHP